MTDAQIAFLTDLEAYAQSELRPHGRYCRNKTGLFRFQGEDVYFRRLSADLVALTVWGERYELPLVD